MRECAGSCTRTMSSVDVHLGVCCRACILRLIPQMNSFKSVIMSHCAHQDQPCSTAGTASATHSQMDVHRRHGTSTTASTVTPPAYPRKDIRHYFPPVMRTTPRTLVSNTGTGSAHLESGGHQPASD